MALTLDDLLTEARELLQDTNATLGYRYSTASLVRYFNDAVREARRQRPDLFIFSFASPVPQASTADGTDYTALQFSAYIPETYFLATVNFVAGRAEIRDDEFAVDGRAMTLMAGYSAALQGAA